MPLSAVLDTNVFVSGIFWAGPPASILGAWRAGGLRLVLSPAILDEYLRVTFELSRQFPEVDISAFVRLVIAHAEVVREAPLPGPVCCDPSDDKFLACALAAKAACIVSGDKHLLAASGFQGIMVLRPRQFVDMYLSPSQ